MNRLLYTTLWGLSRCKSAFGFSLLCGVPLVFLFYFEYAFECPELRAKEGSIHFLPLVYFLCNLPSPYISFLFVTPFPDLSKFSSYAPLPDLRRAPGFICMAYLFSFYSSPPQVMSYTLTRCTAMSKILIIYDMLYLILYSKSLNTFSLRITVIHCEMYSLFHICCHNVCRRCHFLAKCE